MVVFFAFGLAWRVAGAVTAGASSTGTSAGETLRRLRGVSSPFARGEASSGAADRSRRFIERTGSEEPALVGCDARVAAIVEYLIDWNFGNFDVSFRCEKVAERIAWLSRGELIIWQFFGVGHHFSPKTIILSNGWCFHESTRQQRVTKSS